VGKNRIVDAMLLESFTQNISRVAGPFASGTLIAVLGALGYYVALLIISIHMACHQRVLLMSRLRKSALPKGVRMP
ncbi:MAG: hypothetical protein HOE48_14300, partial [Candidatus Latescibacteria bacterium]|nr:hypothetical protein [Candidatus Latescibacterota bacterium]